MEFTARLYMTKAQGCLCRAPTSLRITGPPVWQCLSASQLLLGENWVSLGSYTFKIAEMTKQERR